METVTTSVSYTCTLPDHEDKGKAFTVPFEFTTYDTTAEAVEALGEDKVKGIVNQTLKEDAGNVARENARRAGGHSTQRVLSETEKAENKAQRQADKALLDALKSNPDALAQIQAQL